MKKEREAKLIEALTSSAPELRLSSWDILCGKFLYENLEFRKWLCGKVRYDLDLVEEIIQDAGIAIVGKLHNKELKNTENVRGYVFITLRNAMYARQKERKEDRVKLESLDHLSPKLEARRHDEGRPTEVRAESLRYEIYNESMLEMVLRLPDALDRIVLLLHYYRGLSLRGIACLLALKKNNVEKRINNSVSWLKWHVDNQDLALSPSPWESLFGFAEVQGLIGLYHMNAFNPSNLDPDSQERLLSLTGVKSCGQIPDLFFTALTLNNIGRDLNLQFSLFPRKDVSWDILDGQAVNYVIYDLAFDWITTKGSRKKLPFLGSKRIELKARMKEKIRNSDGILIGSRWAYYRQGELLTVLKPYLKPVRDLYDDPSSHERINLLFMPVPSDDRGLTTSIRSS